MKKIMMSVGVTTLLIASACDADETIVSNGGEGDTPEADVNSDEEVEPEEVIEAQGTEVVNIGYSGPLSGAAAFYGDNTLSGLSVAVNEVNKAGGFEVGGEMYSFNLVSLDDQYLPNEAGVNARRLSQEYDTPIVYIPHSGGIYASQVFNEDEQFMIGAYSSEPDLTDQGNDLTWRIPPTYDLYARPFSEYAMERFGNQLAMLPPSTQYGMDWAEELGPLWEEMGGEIVYDGSIDFSRETDFFTTITNALSDDPDVLFVGGSSEPTAQVMQQARELGFEGGFIVMDQAKIDEIERIIGEGSEEVIEGAVGVPPLIYDVHDGNQIFIDDYQEEIGREPGSEAGYHYLSIMILKEAMIAAGTVEDATEIMASLNDGLNNVPSEQLVYRVTDIDELGGMNTELRFSYVEDGEILIVDPE
ncbi:ABC transporter substrate-binding protein [Geomicrobium sp. JSM 1781026]|uniref:ABC transporter substrate-binding protein n=1 Tax=Geomicrobium sp. JSM 1781026 TaxID=3344580 RepID=UPI0035BFD6B1